MGRTLLLTAVAISLALLNAKAATPDPQDTACARCHQGIYDSYQTTPMAQASGLASAGLLPGEFAHPDSGIHYRTFLRDGHAWLSYERAASTLRGEQELTWFIGSGHRGRTYLFSRQGFWFESPVNWYSKQSTWDMNPKSLHAREMPFTLRVDTGCLHCHATDVQTSLPGARNHFAAEPFLASGIRCRACHGDATAHLASGGKEPILNPAKLTPEKRDSVCLQCHLEGETMVNRRGRSLADYHPGDNLADDAVYFVHAGETGPEGRATSQWEALLQSKCKQKSGDRLTCTTCHDPHQSPSPEQRIGYYRSRCLTCHGSPTFEAKHHPDQPDCSHCHMPREQTGNVAHEQVTDHRIQRRTARLQQGTDAPAGDLAQIGGGTTSDRDLGLAYFQYAQYGDGQAGHKAMQLLQKAERNNEVEDADLHTALGLLDQRSGDLHAAQQEYQQALKANPADATAVGNLAILAVHAGDARGALTGMQWVSEHDPVNTAASLNLAILDCAVGQAQAAIDTLHKLLAFSPDDQKARQTLAAIENKRQACGP